MNFWKRIAPLALLAALLVGCTLLEGPQQVSMTFTGAPVVTLVSPPPNATYAEGVAVNIQVSVSNAGPDVLRVDFSVDNVIVASLDNPNPSGAAVFSASARWTAAGAGSHTVSVSAFRSDGSASETATGTFNVVTQASPTPRPSDTPAAPPTATRDPGAPATLALPTADSGGAASGGGQTAPTADTGQPPAAPTNTPPPAASATPTVPTMFSAQGVNVRTGPSTLFPAIQGGLPANTSAEILALSLDRQWYKIRYNQGFGWVASWVVTASGDLSRLPLEAGPPLPTQAPPTAAPVPTSPGGGVLGVNLTVSGLSVAPAGCGTPFTATVTITNTGSLPTTGGFFVTGRITGPNVTDIDRTVTVSQIIQPGQAVTLTLGSGSGSDPNAPFFMIRTGGQVYNMDIIINFNGVPDVNSGDNTQRVQFSLSGTCS